jgi:hypothetical protein
MTPSCRAEGSAHIGPYMLLLHMPDMAQRLEAPAQRRKKP